MPENPGNAGGAVIPQMGGEDGSSSLDKSEDAVFSKGATDESRSLPGNATKLKKGAGSKKKSGFWNCCSGGSTGSGSYLEAISNSCGRVVRDFEREAKTRCNF